MSLPIPSLPGHFATSSGTIFCFRAKGTVLYRAYPDHQGYLRVRVLVDGKHFWRRVHILVLEAFRGPRPSPRHHGAHRDGDKSNNRMSNLRWATPEENEKDKAIVGSKTGGHYYAPKLKAADVRRIRRKAEKKSYSQIAREEGIHRHSVSRIVRGLRHGGVG